MSKLIRKISIGANYKNDAMHYAVGQEVYGGHTICDIIEEDDKFSIYILVVEYFCVKNKLSTINLFSVIVSISLWRYNKAVNAFH